MSYKSVLVNIDIDGPVIPIVTVAIEIARSHDARLIGLCGADAPLPMAGVMNNRDCRPQHALGELHVHLVPPFSQMKHGLTRRALMHVNLNGDIGN